MTDHEHEWQHSKILGYFGCTIDGCEKVLRNEKAEAVLNEHAALKRESENLKEDMAPFQAQIDQAKTYTVTPDLLSGGE